MRTEDRRVDQSTDELRFYLFLDFGLIRIPIAFHEVGAVSLISMRSKESNRAVWIFTPARVKSRCSCTNFQEAINSPITSSQNPVRGSGLCKHDWSLVRDKESCFMGERDITSLLIDRVLQHARFSISLSI